MITVIQETSLAAFKRDVEPFLRQDVMGNILGLRIMTGITSGKYTDFHLFKVMDDTKVVGAAIRTPPHNVFLSKTLDQCLTALAQYFIQTKYEFPGINGLKTSTSIFADSWNKNTPYLNPRLGLQYYVLDHAEPLRDVAGAPRLATIDDLDLLSDWTDAFAIEAGLAVYEQQRDTEKIKKRITNQEFLIWSADGQPVCYVGHNMIIDGLTNIGPVYTPPTFRRRGYGQACTAAVAQIILSRGDRPVLCADVATATSNKIYQEIGFKPTVQYQEYRFT